jgi:hypothetical protein
MRIHEPRRDTPVARPDLRVRSDDLGVREQTHLETPRPGDALPTDSSEPRGGPYVRHSVFMGGHAVVERSCLVPSGSRCVIEVVGKPPWERDVKSRAA